ncbi:MAG TPA: DUF2007 domain-containing protein [Thermoanaerobacterales bacterium]|nr:DUF2007 domain-containing protein [Thermoanaerobacterales bacterium]
MPYCPKCKVEYREGFYTCTDCNEKLIESLSNEKTEKDHEGLKWSYLMTAYNDIEADIIIGLMNSNGIRAVKKYYGFSEYLKVYMGTAFNIKIFVPDFMLDEAKKIIEDI